MSDQPKNTNTQVVTIPNLLSFFRIALAILFCFLFDSEKMSGEEFKTLMTAASPEE